MPHCHVTYEHDRHPFSLIVDGCETIEMCDGSATDGK